MKNDPLNPNNNFLQSLAQETLSDNRRSLWGLIRFFLNMLIRPMPDKNSMLKKLKLDAMQILVSFAFGSSKELQDNLDEIEITKADAQVAVAFICAVNFVDLDEMIRQEGGDSSNGYTPLDQIVKSDTEFSDWPTFNEEDE